MATRSDILKTATDLFMKYGLRSVSIDDICTQMHISKKTFYTLFRQKDDLIDALLVAICDDHERKYHTLEFRGNAIDQFLSAASLMRVDQGEKWCNFFYDLWKYYPETAKRHERDMRQATQKHFRRWLQVGIDEGLFRSELPIDVMAVIGTHLNNIAIDLRNQTALSMPQAALVIVDIVMHAITTPRGMNYYQDNKQKLR